MKVDIYYNNIVEQLKLRTVDIPRGDKSSLFKALNEELDCLLDTLYDSESIHVLLSVHREPVNGFIAFDFTPKR